MRRVTGPVTGRVRLLAVRLLAVLLLLSGSPSGLDAQRAEPGVSLELARHRAATISGLVYDAAFRLPADPADPVFGTVTIRFRKSDDGPLVLDFADPSAIREVSVAGEPVAYRAESTHLVVPDSVLPEPGELTIRFTAGDGPLNRRDGFLYTLFVPDRAHEALPSFDQPDLKARFRLALTVPAGWTAVANGAETSRDTVGDQVVYRFGETEPLPTYLFAFAAGEFEVETAERDGRTLRLIHRETDAEKVARNRDAVFDLHATALEWLEAYTGIPYPFGKFDVVAIPSFQYNGMEHPGAILYRASSLFLDESATRNQELGRASVIAHETAHMWFGDLVTMRWFSDVWMKEVFANFMAAKIVNPSFPNVDHELRFLLAHYPAAYAVDRTPGANPIRQPLDNLSDAGSLYGAIIYQKAPIVMRQLEALTGEEPFRTAMRRYLDAHRFGNAGWPALVDELDRVTPLDVAAWSRVWIEEAGRPAVRVTREPGAVTLTPADPAGSGRVWPQRTAVGLLGAPDIDGGAGSPASGSGADRAARAQEVAGRSSALRQQSDAGAAEPLGTPARIRRVTLAGEPLAVPRDPDFDAMALPNAEGFGYAHFRLDPTTRDRLLYALPALEEPIWRAAGWLDLREMMLERAVDPAAMLDLGIRMATVESDELVAQQLLGDVESLFWRYVPTATRLAQAARLESTLWSRLETVDGASAKAAYFNAWRSVVTTPDGIGRLREIWTGEREVQGLPLSERDRTTLALELAVRDVHGSDAILDAQRDRIENPDRRDRFEFVRRAASADPAVRDAFFASLASVENRSREEWVTTALSYLHHPLRSEASLRYVRPGLDLLREVHATGDIFFPTRWLSATLGGHASPEAAAIVRAFIDEHPDYPPPLLGKLLQQADPLFRAVALGDGVR